MQLGAIDGGRGLNADGLLVQPPAEAIEERVEFKVALEDQPELASRVVNCASWSASILTCWRSSSYGCSTRACATLSSAGAESVLTVVIGLPELYLPGSCWPS